MSEIETFTCPNHIGELRITATTCASMWLRARREAKESWHRLAPCVGCQIGAANAGASAPARPSPTVSGPSCVRCGQGGRRLVLGKSLCVSCFNRQAEYRAGRNARGGPTRDHPPLYCAVVGVVGETGAVQPTRVEWVSSWIEAALKIERSTGISRFGRVATGWRGAAPFQPAKRDQSAFLVGARSRLDATLTA